MKLNSLKRFLSSISLLLLTILIFAGSYFRILDSFELHALDFRFRLRPRIPVTDKVVFVDISDDSINKLGQFPFDRSYHAVLIKALTDYGAQAIIFDIFFSEPQMNDAEFEDAIAKAGNVYLPFVLELHQDKTSKITHAVDYAAQNLEPFTVLAKGTGHINIIPDDDGKFRRVPLLIQHNDTLEPYLSFLVTLDTLKISKESIDLQAGRYLKINPNYKIPLDENSNMIINFSGKWGESFKHYSYVDVLRSYIALEMVLKQIGQGDLTTDTHLRKTDQLIEFQEALDSLREILNQRVGNMKKELIEIEQLLRESNDPTVISKINEKVHFLKDEINHFKVTSDNKNVE